jgi:hypothetical protein
MLTLLKLRLYISRPGPRQDDCLEDPYIQEIISVIQEEHASGHQGPVSDFQLNDIGPMMAAWDSTRRMKADGLSHLEELWRQEVWTQLLRRISDRPQGLVSEWAV